MLQKSRADEGIDSLKRNCDTLLVIPNETLLEITDQTTSVNDSFKLADSVLYQATKGISDLINVPGLINLHAIESPGMTSSLAIASHVKQILN